MKQKLTLLILALVTSMGAWADGLLVSTTESASAEYQYKIFCRGVGTSYYLGDTTNATNSGADYGLFAFFADTSGDYTNGYYIYSIFEGKWVTYSAGESYTEGKNKISLVADKPSVPWNIAADDSNSKYYDIRPFKTDKTVANVSWNWHGGTTANTSNTMGFYDYTDGNSGWGIVLAGGSGSPVADRKVVALYNRDTNNDEYPITPNSGVVVAGSTTAAAQLFVLKHNGIDSNGEAQYNLMKAEADGNYLRTPDSPTSSVYGTSPTNYLLINQSCSFISNYTKTKSDFASSTYYNLIASNGSYRSLHSNNNGANMNGWTTDSPNVYVQYGAKGTWNNLWAVKEQSYTAWQVVMSGATSGTVTYGGSALISGGTATQSNNGMFVLSATPSASDFTTSFVEGYLSDPVITIDDNRKIIKVVYTSYTDTYNTITTALSTAPEGIGYPTTTARTRLQAAIDTFDASKTTANLAALSTQYNSFLTNVVLPEGKVYTIQNYIKSPSATTYLKNESGTLTIGAEASATKLNNLWVVRKSGNNYVLQSAADLTKYIVYTSFTLAASGSAWTLSQGTEWPYISMYNSTLARFVASNGDDQFGTAGSGGYYANARTQTNGWSTDFKFVESTDYALYKVKIIYPSGTTPTVTYNEIAYSNGSDFVAPKTLSISDLAASVIDGYTSNVSIVGDVIYVYYDVTYSYADTWNFDNNPWLLLNDAPAAIDNPTRTYRYNTKRINLVTTYNSSIVVKFAYTTGSYRIDVAGVDLIDPSTGDVVYYDYHDGYSGIEQSNREYTINNVAPGNYILRYISYDQSTSSAGNISVLVTPTAGFYRIQGNTSGKYLAAGFASNNKFAMTDATDATTIFYYDGTKLTNFSSGMCNGVTASSWAWVTGDAASTVAFEDGKTNGGYLIHTSDAYFFDDGTSADRGSSYDDRSQYRSWYLTEITSLPVTVSAAGYATLYAPVALTIPSGVQAYYISSLTTTEATLTEISTTIPAETPVVLKATAGTYDFVITTGGTDVSESNKLNGSVTAFAVSSDEVSSKKYYTLQRNAADETIIGLYPKTAAGSIAGFKAYMLGENIPVGVGVKGFTFIFEDDADAISLTPALSEGEGAIYNLAGQRLNKMQKGINIVNGKKILK